MKIDNKILEMVKITKEHYPDDYKLILTKSRRDYVREAIEHGMSREIANQLYDAYNETV